MATYILVVAPRKSRSGSAEQPRRAAPPDLREKLRTAELVLAPTVQAAENAQVEA